MVLAGAVLLSSERFNIAREQEILPPSDRNKISDVAVWAGDESGRNWVTYSVAYQHNLHETNHSMWYSALVNSTKRSPLPSTTAYTSLVRLEDWKALLTYDNMGCGAPLVARSSFSMEISF